MKYHFFDRLDDAGEVIGVTVSKYPELPDGDIALSEYVWQGAVSLWFVDSHVFSKNERFEACQEFLKSLIV